MTANAAGARIIPKRRNRNSNTARNMMQDQRSLYHRFVCPVIGRSRIARLGALACGNGRRGAGGD
jgi:hypothetical protein